MGKNIFYAFFVVLSVSILSGCSNQTITPIENKDISEKEAKESFKSEVAEQKEELEQQMADAKEKYESLSSEQSKTEKLYRVVKVTDGDTIEVDIDGTTEKLRLIGINTPETLDPRKPVECFGKEASNKAKELLSDKSVRLESDPTQGERDKYGRLLRYVFLEDYTNFNQKMIADGYAYEYTYGTPYKYQDDFKKAQKEALEAKRGLWASDTCNGTKTEVKTVMTTPAQTLTPAPKPASSEKYSCARKTCGQMASCDEAYYQLETCGNGALDRDKDGVPCETICN